jgi:predicted heme/steroid binding protein
MITMKKTLLPILMLGIAFSSVSVFAEQENERGQGKGILKQESFRAEVKSALKTYKEDIREMGNKNGSRQDVMIPSAPEISRVEAVTERPDSSFGRSVARISSRAMQLIKERINVLNANTQAITASNTLTAEQKTSLTALLSSNITGLTALKASIASSTDASTAKALTNSIFTNFRIYGIVIPQARLEKRVFDLQNHSQKLSDLFVKVQTTITDAKAQGKDVTVWQKSLDDTKVLVATDMAKLAGLLPKLATLTPATYGTTSKAIIDSVNADIKSVAKDFNSISKTLRRPSSLGNGTGTTTPPVVVPPTTSTSTVVAGSCGTTNGTTIPATPTANLCSSGVSSTVAGSGPWTWSCTGSNGGTTASCYASKTAVVTPPVASGYTTAQLASHATRADCWIAVSGKVYSVSNYISMHPGGSTAIVNVCGQDATTVFNNRGGTGSHSNSAKSTLGTLLLGNLI